MISQSVVYPPSPVEVSHVVKQVNIRFRREVGKTLISIAIFFLVYLALMFLAVILALLTVYGGVLLILAAPKFITLMIGLGLIGLGVMVFFFLVKFIFSVSKYDHSNSIEIFETDQPGLFAFIRQLSKETRTSFPRKIFISPEVNASVFYNSSFWSMFLPVRKNLQIGLGLVNVLTVSEFKAVVAHEFGHFSQRSMKLGSFVYNVNKVIYNLLYQNTGYGNTLNVWANIHTLFALFASLTVKIVQGIQWILRKMYAFVNKNYMGLSREMEFHADAVAAGVTGSESMITALSRLDLADESYNVVLTRYSDLLKEKQVAANVYQDHQVVMQQMLSEHRPDIKSNVANAGETVTTHRVYNRVNYKDQWASHPPIEERIKQLAGLGIICEPDNSPAWQLFQNADLLQAALTKKIYEHAAVPEEAVAIDAAIFEERYLKEQEKYKLPAIFNGFFDSRDLVELDMQRIAVEVANETDAGSLADLVSPENTALPKIIAGLRSDIAILEQITMGIIDIKSFDFDGKKYPAKEAGAVKEKLETELKTAAEKLVQIDHDFIRYFDHLSRKNSSADASLFRKDLMHYHHVTTEFTRFIATISETTELLAPLYTDESLTLDTVNQIVTELKNVKEPLFKETLTYWINECDLDCWPGLADKASAFLDKDYRYFIDNNFLNNELDEYRLLLHEMCTAAAMHRFLIFKNILCKGVAMVPEQHLRQINNQVRA